METMVVVFKHCLGFKWLYVVVEMKTMVYPERGEWERDIEYFWSHRNILFLDWNEGAATQMYLMTKPHQTVQFIVCRLSLKRYRRAKEYIKPTLWLFCLSSHEQRVLLREMAGDHC